MVKRLVVPYYTGVSRYTTRTFFKIKLKDTLLKRGMAPHINGTKVEAVKNMLE